MRRSSLVAVLLFPSLYACGGPSQRADPVFDREAVVDSVTAAVRAFDAAVHARDVAGMLAFYAPDSAFRYLSDGQVLRYSELVPMMRSFWPTVRTFEGALTSIEVVALNADAAISRTPYWEAMTDTSGQTVRQRGDITMAWVRRDGSWRILYTHAVHVPDTSRAR